MTAVAGIDALAILCAIGIVLQVADYATTRLVIERGTGREGNQIILKLMGIFGTRAGLILAKLVGVGAFVIFYVQSVEWFYPAAFDLYYLVIVYNNYRIARL